MRSSARSVRQIRAPLRHLAAAVALAGLAALAACDAVTAPREGLTGRWSSDDGRGDGVTGAPIALVLEQHGEAVTGAGSYTLGGNTIALDVDGTIRDRVVVLTLTPQPAQDPRDEILLQGMLSDDAARLTTALTLGRQTETRVFGRG